MSQILALQKLPAKQSLAQFSYFCSWVSIACIDQNVCG